MARIRTIKPDYFLDEGLSEVSLEAHFLLAGLWTLADREGRLEDRPRRIKVQVFPYREVDVDKALGELSAAGYVVRYEANGERLIQVQDWERDQRPHVKEAASAFPPPAARYTEHQPSTNPAPTQHRRVPGELTAKGVSSPLGSGNRDLGIGIVDPSLPGSEPRPPVSYTSAEELPDATEHAELESNHPEKPESSTPDWPPALQLQPREEFRLSSPKAARTRKPSAAERLYAQLEETRKARCEERGVAFVAEDWAPARQNTSLGRFAKLEPAEQERFEAAWAEYLSDDAGAVRNPPWSLGWFLASKSTWESKALRGAS